MRQKRLFALNSRNWKSKCLVANCKDRQEFWNQNEGLADVATELVRSVISGFPLTSSTYNYNEAIDLLKRRYGKKNAIQKAHIQELMNMKPVYNDRDTEKQR
jgi:hypothetical protein